MALAITPFLQYGHRFGLMKFTGDGIVEKTNEIWGIGPNITLLPIEWPYPHKPVYDIFPDSWSLSKINVGYRIIAYYGGHPSEQHQYQVIPGVPRWSVMARKGDPEKALRTRYLKTIEYAVGWPFPSMYGRVRYRLSEEVDPVSRGFAFESPRYEWAIQLDNLHTFRNGTRIPVMDDALLPLRPILFGTVANSVFYGLIFYAAFWIVLRRLWRLLTGAKKRERFKRGECIGCGYPLGDLGRCPECGIERKFRKTKVQKTADRETG